MSRYLSVSFISIVLVILLLASVAYLAIRLLALEQQIDSLLVAQDQESSASMEVDPETSATLKDLGASIVARESDNIQTEPEVPCPDWRDVRYAYIKSLDEQEVFGYWRDTMLNRYAGVIQLATFSCDKYRMAGGTILETFGDQYLFNRNFRYAVWCMIEPGLSERELWEFSTMLKDDSVTNSEWDRYEATAPCKQN